MVATYFTNESHGSKHFSNTARSLSQFVSWSSSVSHSSEEEILVNMEASLDRAVKIGKGKHPKVIERDIQYGTAGFRTKYVYICQSR